MRLLAVSGSVNIIIKKMEISLQKLEWLLQEQKRLVIEKLSQNTHMYNTESTDSHTKSLTIDKEKFTEIGMKAELPKDVQILKNYGIK